MEKGVGGLERIVDELYANFAKEGVTASIYVVCGRNEKLKENLENKDWQKVVNGERKPRKRDVLTRIRRKFKKKPTADQNEATGALGDVKVVGLGYVTQMAEYMVAADICVT